MKLFELESIKEVKAKKILILLSVSILTIICLIITILYASNKEFRNLMDKYVLMKNVMENAVTSIPIEENQTSLIYAYDKYISILSQNKLIGYNSLGRKEYEIDVEISNPIIDTSGRFLLIGEANKQKIYLISGSEIVWEKDLEGNISRVSVNKNGYVSVVLTGTTYKSIIQTFNASGVPLFKTYLNSLAVDCDISSDNKYLSFVEIGTNGTQIQSIIKTVSIQNAQENREQAIISTFKLPSDITVLNIKYQDGNKLICMYENSIHIIQNENDEEILSLQETGQKIPFADVELVNHAYRILEKSSFLNTQSTVEIIDTANKKINTYELDSVVKEVYAYNEKVALNLGSEVHFIGMNGWLLRKYISTQEVRKIVMANNFAGIVYRDKIEIIEM